jgi:hypothetical protein
MFPGYHDAVDRFVRITCDDEKVVEIDDHHHHPSFFRRPPGFEVLMDEPKIQICGSHLFPRKKDEELGKRRDVMGSMRMMMWVCEGGDDYGFWNVGGGGWGVCG